MRVVRSLLALALMGFACAACDGLSIETAKRTAADTGTVEETGGSETDAGDDTALDTGAEDTAIDTATDTAADTAVDTAPDTAADTATDTEVDTSTDADADAVEDTTTDTAEDTADVCPASYHMDIESGGCVSDTRSCSSLPANTTAGTQTWDSITESYGSCVATACANGYDVYFGVCEFGQPVGATCGSGEDCTSGNCATAPVGFGSNRCAPTGMNFIPADTFMMGSPLGEVGRGSDETQHTVTLTRPFFMAQTEVTQGQWKAISGGINPSYFQSTTGTAPSTDNANDSGPVENIDWYAAVAFANASSAAEGLASCYELRDCTDAANGWKDGIHDGCTDATFAGRTCTGYRLPTESEWEYSARGGTTTATYLGNLSGEANDCAIQANLDGIAWWCGNSGGRTQAVGGKTANNFGLYDMLGNVREWTGDWYNEIYPDTVDDPTGYPSGTYRACRGESWGDRARFARAAFRQGNAVPGTRNNFRGFRLARTAP